MAENKVKIVFHIANSIKGGSGKSTISFLLAHYYSRIAKGSRAVIIDLDVNGSSWKYDHKINDLNCNYLQDYMYKPERIESNDDMHLKYQSVENYNDKNGEEMRVTAFLSDPERNFKMSECEIDLFENAIYNIVKKVINSAKDEENIVHIIFDMPPSYEEHADRIINHLLVDLNSPLYKKYKGEYIVIHYLICACLASHIQLNKNYIKSFKIKNNSYSNMINDLVKKGKYHFVLTFNDIHKNIIDSTIDDETDKVLWNKFPPSLKKSLRIKTAYVKHFNPETMNIRNCLDRNERQLKVIKQMHEAMDELTKIVNDVLKKS